jgi:transcriptional/translational regulatory protein YebC/TACO1
MTITVTRSSSNYNKKSSIAHGHERKNHDSNQTLTSQSKKIAAAAKESRTEMLPCND